MAKILTAVMSAAAEGGGGKGVKRSADEEGHGGAGGGGAKRAREEDEQGPPGGLQASSIGDPCLAHKDAMQPVVAEAPVTGGGMSAEVVGIVEGGIKDKGVEEEEEEGLGGGLKK